MVPWNSALGRFAYNWQSKWVGIISIKTERTQIHFLATFWLQHPGCQMRGFRFRSNAARVFGLRPNTCLPVARSSPSHARKNLWYPGYCCSRVASNRRCILLIRCIVFNFSWGGSHIQEKWKTKDMQNFGGQIRCIIGDVQKSEMSHVSTP